jgi:hypothetical protein
MGSAARTLGILAPADLDELLDVADFGRHFGGMWVVDGFRENWSPIVYAATVVVEIRL